MELKYKYNTTYGAVRAVTSTHPLFKNVKNWIEIDELTYAKIEPLCRAELRSHWRDEKMLSNYELSVDMLDGLARLEAERQAQDPFHIIASNDEITELQTAILQLLPEQQILIRQIFFEGRRPLDIAKASQVSKQAIDNRLRKVYQQLRKKLQ